MRDQAIRVASRCLWDPTTDNYASTSFTNVRISAPHIFLKLFLFNLYFNIYYNFTHIFTYLFFSNRKLYSAQWLSFVFILIKAMYYKLELLLGVKY